MPSHKPLISKGELVIFTRASPTEWSSFVDTGEHIAPGEVGLVVGYETSDPSKGEVLFVYHVLIKGRVTKAWPDEIARLPEQLR